MELIDHKQRMDECDQKQYQLAQMIKNAEESYYEAEAIYDEEVMMAIQDLRDKKTPATFIKEIARGLCKDAKIAVGKAKALLNRCKNEYENNRTSITISQTQLKYYSE